MTRKTSLRIAGYILFFLFFTLVFTVLNYPRENLTGMVNQWLSESSNDMLSVKEAYPVLPLSVRLSEVSLDSGGSRQILGRALVSPDFTAFLTGKNGFVVRFNGPWGSTRFRLVSDEDGWGIRVGSLQADLGSLPYLENGPFSMEGVIEGSGNLRVKSPSGNRIDGEGRISGEGIQIKSGLLEPLGLSPLHISGFNGFFTIKDNVLSLGENLLEGDLSVKARGTVRLVPNHLENSRLDLTLEITPGSGLKEKVVSLLSLLRARPGVDGSVTLRIRGNIGRPSISG